MVSVGMISPCHGKNHAGFAPIRHLPMPSESRHGGPRGLVLSTKVDLLASVRWNCPPRPPRGQVGTPPNRTAEKICGQPGNYVIRALRAAPSPPELSSPKKSTATVAQP